ncbi:MAG: Nif11-like leader peptide family natural product precursor [Desulfobulbaceae bacterium]|nr:Nif11-like leader peptide family natural product precursor [Desulfobulbaceae bacterium]
MAKKNVEEFLIAGGESQEMRNRYDAIRPMDEFVSTAVADGFDFTAEELEAVLKESGDSFDLIGNPAKRQIWWK